MSRAGPNPNSSVVQALPPSSIGRALISTPLSIRSASSPGSTKDGTVVVKRVAVLGGASRAGPRSPVVGASPSGAGGG